MQMFSKRLTRWAVIIALLLLIPLVMTLRDRAIEGGWKWSPFDFVVMGALLFGAALTYELNFRKMTNLTYRIAVGMAVMASLLLLWMNAAVGIIGSESNPMNVMYFGVVAIGFFGAIIARGKPSGMARTAFAMAAAQASVPVIAFMARRPDFSPGVLQVFVLNAFFVILFTGSAMLFRHAAAKHGVTLRDNSSS